MFFLVPCRRDLSTTQEQPTYDTVQYDMNAPRAPALPPPRAPDLPPREGTKYELTTLGKAAVTVYVDYEDLSSDTRAGDEHSYENAGVTTNTTPGEYENPYKLTQNEYLEILPDIGSEEAKL